MKKRKVKSDQIFILVAAVVVSNLAYQLIKSIINMASARLFLCPWCWTLIIANIIAIIGMLWLLQNYRRRRRVEKEAESQKEDKDKHLE